MSIPIRLAVAGEHTYMRECLVSYLTQGGAFTVVAEADSGAQLFKLLQSAAELPEICLMDIPHPSPEATASLKDIVLKWPSVKTLLLSDYNYEFNMLRVLKAGVNGIFSRHGEMKLLVKALNDIYEHGFFDAPFVRPQTIYAARRNAIIVPTISAKERDFLRLCCRELSYKQIADQMGLTKRNIERYRDKLCEKLKVAGREGLMIFAFKSGYN